MNETWAETKARLSKRGIVLKTPMPAIKARYDESKPTEEIQLWEVRKITLPVDSEFPQGKVILNAVTKEEADWWLENKLKTKAYQDDTDDTKTLVFYEKFPLNGTPKERNMYSNPERFCTEEFPEFNRPRRIN
jgi:hypothetical protein